MPNRWHWLWCRNRMCPWIPCQVWTWQQLNHDCTPHTMREWWKWPVRWQQSMWTISATRWCSSDCVWSSSRSGNRWRCQQSTWTDTATMCTVHSSWSKNVERRSCIWADRWWQWTVPNCVRSARKSMQSSVRLWEWLAMVLAANRCGASIRPIHVANSFSPFRWWTDVFLDCSNKWEPEKGRTKT